MFAALAPDMITCPSVSLCVGALMSSDDIYTSSDPAGGASSWAVTALGSGQAIPKGISCPSVSLCVISRADGTIAASANPAGGPQAWRTASIDPRDGLADVVCSTAPRCFATSFAGNGRVFASSDPTGGAAAWSMSPGTPTFDAGACPTTRLCVTVTGREIAATTNLYGTRWTKTSVADNLNSISCPSASLCVAAGATGSGGGALDVSTDPAAGSWTHVTVDRAGLELSSVSCASTSLCVATDDIGMCWFRRIRPAARQAGPSPSSEAGPCGGASPCSSEKIQASDKFGFHTFDTSATPGSGPFLTGLTLNGDTLSWSHAGTPETVTLTPP